MNKDREKEKKRKIAPPLGLPGVDGLLDKRRVEYSIPNEVFRVAAVYDRILVYQLLLKESETFTEGGLVVKTETYRAAERRTTPTGIVVSAGCEALDILRSNGIDLGHMVFYTQLAFYRVPVHTILGEDINLVVLKAGEIVASVDLSYALQSRQTRIIQKDRVVGKGVDGKDIIRTEHVLVDDKGKAWNPVLGFTPDDL